MTDLDLGGPPDIVSMDELITREEWAKEMGVTVGTVDQWRYGRSGAWLPMPYFRMANRIYLWRGGIIWWINQQRKKPDLVHIDRMRRNERGFKVGKPRPKRNS